MRVTYTSDESEVADGAGRVAVDEFDVNFVQQCYDMGLALNQGIDDYTYEIYDTAPAVTTEAIFDILNDPNGDCDITYDVQYKLASEPDTAYAPTDTSDGWIAGTSSARGTAGTQIQEQDTSKYAAPTTYDIWLQMQGSGPYAQVVAADHKF